MTLSMIEPILVEPVYPGNVGAVARSAHNYGVNTLKIVGDIDLFDVEAKKMALYGYPLLQAARRFTCLEEAVADCHLVVGAVQQGRANRTAPRPIWEVFDEYRDRLLSGRTGLVFGREDNGLTREEIDVCHVLATIPTPFDLSFNLAHSASIVLYEIYHALHGAERSTRPDMATHAQFEELLQQLQQTLGTIGFFRGNNVAGPMTQLRDIVFRSPLAVRDIPMIRAVLYKVRNFATRALPFLPSELTRDCSTPTENP
ncbi:hypothetical protein JXA80_12320 [bacterium]|nr:hypothetical protein [candidate division CSSED10-310 bacterium]